MESIQPGGPLFSLPREIRDEIYRCLVKGRYVFFQPWMNHTRHPLIQMDHLPIFQKADLAIFRVSKATFDEATSIFYSESVFRCHIDQYHRYTMIFPREVSNRMMKIDVGIGKVISPSGSRNRVCPDEIEGGLCITLDNFSGLGSLRNAIAIRFQLAPFYLDLVLSRRLFRIMKALVGFRTVFVCVGPPPEFSKDNDERYIKFAREIEEEMVSTMGPSTMRQVGLRTYLEFHPLEHMQADLRAQMDS